MINKLPQLWLEDWIAIKNIFDFIIMLIKPKNFSTLVVVMY